MPCRIEGCNHTVLAREMCSMHYSRWRVKGDPLQSDGRRRQSEASRISIEGSVAVIELTQGKFATIDTSDIAFVKGFNWYFSASTGYAYSKGSGAALHQILMGTPPEGLTIDHENRNKLDCRRSNMLFVTHSQNMFNRKEGKHVLFNKQCGKHMAYFRLNRKQIYLGLYPTEEGALAAVERAFGIFAQSGNLDEFKLKWKEQHYRTISYCEGEKK
jgi:hypothetical protein